MGRRTYIIIAITSLLVLLFLIILILLKIRGAKHNSLPTTTITAPTPNVSSQKSLRLIKPETLRDVPTLPPSQGGGLDTNSPIAKASIQAIANLGSYLPYQKEFTSSSGVAVSILIPSQNLQANNWTLTAQIFGIDYHVNTSDPTYQSMRASFQEAASDVFSWVRSHNVDPQKIIFSWGDRAYIQQQAETWLNK